MRIRVTMVAALLLLPAAAPAAAAAPAIKSTADFDPPQRRDTRDVPGQALDLREVTFGQRDTRLLLKVRTQGGWNASSLRPDALCLSITPASDSRVLKVCIGARSGKAVLLYQRVTQHEAGPLRVLATPVIRSSQGSISASFSARSIELPRGRLRWSYESRSQDDAACADGCLDRLPDRGAYVATVKVLARPWCFGAAARAPGRPCSNPALARTLIPTPDQALLDPGAPCQPIGPPTLARPCEFGYREGAATPDVLLLGDSHANSWRGAINVAAHARGWRGVSMTRPGCALSTEVYPSAPPGPQQCRQRNADAIRWLGEHPSVHTVFTAASAGRGLSPGGFGAMFGRLPPTVRNVYVIRDVPRARLGTPGCVRAIRRKRLRTAGACAVPRAGAILADPAFAAAQSGPSRIRAIDLTRHFCDSARCYPVVGGAFVYSDDNHMNAAFSATLGPFLLRGLR